jgi:carbonic anhydrase
LSRALIVSVLTAAVAVCANARLHGQDAAHERYVSPWKTPWDYQGARGPDRWSELDPAYAACNEGRQQSPIDIRDAVRTDLPALRFVSRRDPLKYVVNNGHTIRVNYHRGNGNLLLANGQRYELTQFHFHRPSEASIAGRTYPMEAHLMYQTNEGKAAGVTVFITSGRPNLVVEKLWKHMPNAEGQNGVAGVQIDPSGLLPGDTHSYFTYMGSVTGPPCTEGVTWFVLKTPIGLSDEQINAFGKLYPNNVRPVQPLNGRVVKESR